MYAFIDLEPSGGKFNKVKIIEIANIIYNVEKNQNRFLNKK